MEPWELLWADYYEDLGISPRATVGVIRGAYRAMAKEFHPDNGSADPERMLRINIAFEVLSDPSRRHEYDIAYARRSQASGDRSSGEDQSHSPRTEAGYTVDDRLQDETGSQTRASLRIPIFICAVVLLGIILWLEDEGIGNNASSSTDISDAEHRASLVALRATQESQATQVALVNSIASTPSADRSTTVRLLGRSAGIMIKMDDAEKRSNWQEAIRATNTLFVMEIYPGDLEYIFDKREQYIEKEYWLVVDAYEAQAWDEVIDRLRFLIEVGYVDSPSIRQMLRVAQQNIR
jgi:curved DNA-binding protein CbpA